MGLKSYLFYLADFFFPPKCLICNALFTPENSRYFCNTCYDSFLFTKKPICKKCGLPFETDAGEDHLCGQCIKIEPFFDKARSIGVYEGALRKAIHGFKYNERSMLSKPLSQIMAAQGTETIHTKDYDTIIPVPLHPKKLRQRGFNQALILAKTAGKKWGVAVSAASLKRVKWTPPQTLLSGKDRRENVKNAFYCSPGRMKNKNILVIDDVYTSGSTVNECARVLKKNGALTVDILTLARTR